MVKLVNLNEDITLDILLCCDVFSILRMEETCRYLRKVSLYRQLWLTLATNLDFDHAPNLLPHESLQSLSTERLREMVIRSTRSCLNWSRPEGPKPSRSISFEIPVQTIMLEKLLPGGKYYVVLESYGSFYCYDTDRQEQIGSYTGPSFQNEVVHRMDCLLVNEGKALVLAYGSTRLADAQECVTIVRFDIHSGASEIARIFTFALDVNLILSKFVIGREFVVVQEHTRVLVCNWRTGEATVVVFDSQSFIYSAFITHSYLCVVESTPEGSFDFSALPFSVIFPDRSGKSGTTDPYTYVRSQDIFRDFTRVVIFSPSDGTTEPLTASSSACTSSWKTPSMCEHDGPETPTRILLRVLINPIEYMVFEFIFSPATTTPLDSHSLLSIADDAPQNGYTLMHRRQSLALSYNTGRDIGLERLTSATRAGRLFAIYRRYRDNGLCATAINMLDPLEETSSGSSTTSILNKLCMGQTVLTNPMDRLLDGVGVGWNGIQVEAYSGLIWYRSGSTLFIHHTD